MKESHFETGARGSCGLEIGPMRQEQVPQREEPQEGWIQGSNERYGCRVIRWPMFAVFAPKLSFIVRVVRASVLTREVTLKWLVGKTHQSSSDQERLDSGK